MDAFYTTRESGGMFPWGKEAAPDLFSWFSVSGDVDDFIYYDDTEKPHSEK